MNALEEAKKKYDETAIPEELSERIMREIKKSDKKRRKKLSFIRGIKSMAAAAAAVVFVFTAALNMSVTFAEAAGRLPVIGAVARVLTFRSYENETGGMSVSVEIPEIETISEDFGAEADKVNQEIFEICESYAREAVKRAEDYREAFLATGGTEEEWEAHDIQIKVWYEVKSQSEKYLSLKVMGQENWSSAYNKARYYNFDLINGSIVMLEDILGSDYKEKADAEIKRQMEEDEKAGAVYFEDFSGINDETEFYINADGEPVIVFEPYEIAPGGEGEQEFVIGKGTAEWKKRITDFMGTVPTMDDKVSEGGSKNSSWRAGDLAASTHQMKDILTVSFQPAVGELK